MLVRKVFYLNFGQNERKINTGVVSRRKIESLIVIILPGKHVHDVISLSLLYMHDMMRESVVTLWAEYTTSHGNKLTYLCHVNGIGGY